MNLDNIMPSKVIDDVFNLKFGYCSFILDNVIIKLTISMQSLTATILQFIVLFLWLDKSMLYLFITMTVKDQFFFQYIRYAIVWLCCY